MSERGPVDILMEGVAWEALPGTVTAPDLDGLPVATHRGVLRVQGLELECFQLSDGQRVISEDGVVAFFAWLSDEQEPGS